MCFGGAQLQVPRRQSGFVAAWEVGVGTMKVKTLQSKHIHFHKPFCVGSHQSTTTTAMKDQKRPMISLLFPGLNER